MGSSFIVDCSEPAKVDVFMNANKKDFTHVFTTHKHHDHSGGNLELKSHNKLIVGGKDDNIPGCDVPVVHEQVLEMGKIKITCLHTPCHTRGHILYLCEVEGVEGSHEIHYSGEYQ